MENNQELYDKGFDEGFVDSPKDENEEVLEQPTDTIEEETEETLDEEITEETTEEVNEDSDTAEQDTEQEEEPFIEVERYGQKIKMSKEEASKFASFGFDYTAKTQDLAKKRHILDMLDGIEEEELKAFLDARNGDTQALGYIAKQAKVDPYDIDTDSAYAPKKVEQRNYALDDAISDIKADPSSVAHIDNWINSLPQSVYSVFSTDPQVLRDLHQETRAGIAQQVMPEVIKQMALNPYTDFKSAYLGVREQVVNNKPTKETPSRESVKKATIVKKTPSSKKIDHKSVWEDDELYAEMHRMLKNS